MDNSFRDEPAAHGLYAQMVKTMQKATTLSWVCDYRCGPKGEMYYPVVYKIWLKKPNYARVETKVAGQADPSGILVGDGDFFWIYWPQGKPRFDYEETGKYAKEYKKYRRTFYMKKRTPLGRHSISHEVGWMEGNMSMLVINPSIFHGYVDPRGYTYSLEPYLDGVRGMGAETVGDEPCDVVELSFMKYQRSWYLWLARSDYLPRKLKGVVRVNKDLITEESWSDVTINAEIPNDRFVWSPPQGWKELRLPDEEESLLKPGTPAPDFELAAVGGGTLKLSNFRGQLVWLNIWRCGCPACRRETGSLQKVYSEYKGQGLVVLGVNTSDDHKIALDYLKANGVSYPNILDTSDAAHSAMMKYDVMGISGVPLSYLIDREGKVVEAWYGYEEGRAEKALKKLGL